MVRLFVAVRMPEAVQHEIATIQKQLQECALFEGRYVDPAIAHTTVAFIGNVPQDSVGAIKTALKMLRSKAMVAHLENVDAFYHNDEMRIIYISFACPELLTLASAMDNALAQWKKKEKNTFVNHITIARVKKVYNIEKLRENMSAITFKHIDFLIQSFTLEQSVLLSDGPRYEIIEQYFLL